MKKVAVLDYGIGNVKSQLNAFHHVGADAFLTAKSEEILNADICILPGVGAFKHGMENLERKGLIPIIHEFIATGRPFMGICLGMQLLFEDSMEFGYCKGLGLIGGHILQMDVSDTPGLKLPHIGWTDIQIKRTPKSEKYFLHNIENNTPFYFVHSFAAIADHESDILATANYGNKEFCCAVQKKNVSGTQFHPEKSGEKGLQLLKNIIEI